MAVRHATEDWAAALVIDDFGDTEWIPPPHLDHGRPRANRFHHPEKLLADEDDDP